MGTPAKQRRASAADALSNLPVDPVFRQAVAAKALNLVFLGWNPTTAVRAAANHVARKAEDDELMRELEAALIQCGMMRPGESVHEIAAAGGAHLVR